VRLEPKEKVFPSASNWELRKFTMQLRSAGFLMESDSQLRVAQ